METPDVGMAHKWDDLFRGRFTGVDDVSDIDASIIFDKAQRLLNQVVTLHQEAFSKCRAELNRCEADLKRLTEERDVLKLLYVQKEEEVRDFRAELATTHKEQTDHIEQILQVQQKAEKIEQHRKELQSVKEESLALAKKLEELEARLDAKLANATSEAEKVKAEVEAEAVVTVYRADAKAAHARAKEIFDVVQVRSFCVAEHVKSQSPRETLKEIHARGFDLTTDIENAKVLEAEAKLCSLMMITPAAQVDSRA
ncbi:uncharacterized protein [Nicotiana sylvestris]|uniref:uncharacterized protein n=1 Tax=Nicotiana sylvestris TaxID=4096 RepID=UPI00388C75E6